MSYRTTALLGVDRLAAGREDGLVDGLREGRVGMDRARHVLECRAHLDGQVVAPEASELIAELGFALEMGARLEDVIGTIHTHPTLSEAVHEACADALDRAIHQ